MAIKLLPPLSEDWQYQERHSIDVHAALKADGCMDTKGQLRAWHGQRSQDALESAGHNTLDYIHCCCKKTS